MSGREEGVAARDERGVCIVGLLPLGLRGINSWNGSSVSHSAEQETQGRVGDGYGLYNLGLSE